MCQSISPTPNTGRGTPSTAQHSNFYLIHIILAAKRKWLARLQPEKTHCYHYQQFSLFDYATAAPVNMNKGHLGGLDRVSELFGTVSVTIAFAVKFHIIMDNVS